MEVPENYFHNQRSRVYSHYIQPIWSTTYAFSNPLALPLKAHPLVHRWTHYLKLTCPAGGIGSGWTRAVAALRCCQAPAATAACSGARRPQSRPTGTRDGPAPPTLGRKAYVWSVLEHQHNPRRRGAGGEGEGRGGENNNVRRNGNNSWEKKKNDRMCESTKWTSKTHTKKHEVKRM